MIDYIPPSFDEIPEEGTKEPSAYEYVIETEKPTANICVLPYEPTDEQAPQLTDKNKRRRTKRASALKSTVAPRQDQLMGCAKEIKEIFGDGFQWHDIASMMMIWEGFFLKSKISTRNSRSAGPTSIHSVSFGSS